MKKHMGKRILAIALAAVMMSSVVDYSCMIEVRAEEINTESAETTGESNESAETTRESNEATETTDAASESDVTETEPAAEPTDEITVVEEQKATPAVSSEVTLSEETQIGESQTEEPQTGESQTEEPQLEEPQTEEPVENVEETSEQEDAEKETKEQTQMAEGTVEIDPEILEQLPNNDELFAGHVEQVLYGNNEIALYSNYGESRLTEVDLAVYRCMKRRIEEIAEGKTSSTVLKIPYSELEQEGGAYSKLSYVRMYRVLEALLRDNPYSMYWFDTTSSFAYNCYGISRSFEVYLPVSADYAGSAEYTTDSTKLGRVKTAADNARKIVSEASKLDDYHKLLTYKNKICEYTSYNFFAATDENTKYGDPWQLIYVFDGDEATKVVCEGYAKAFQYLCDLSTFQNDIVCYTLTGGMNGEGHMWNIVHMDDGKNYLVDVTNCDDRSEEYFVIPFLIGTDTGSPETGYTYHLWNDITYTYDNSNRLYDGSVLKIAENKYVYGWQDNQPTTPTEPTTPSQPITPTEPSAPTTPEQPSVPEQPSTPATPTQPEQPSEEPEVEPDTLNVTVGNIKVQSYTGKGITPKIVVKDNATKKKLKQGKQYTVSYENNVNAGTGTIVLTGINGYEGVKRVDFTIQPQNIAKKIKAKVNGKKFRYAGTALTPGVTVTYGKMVLVEGTDYEISYADNNSKGTAKIYLKGNGNYTGTRTVKFKITGPQMKEAEVTLSASSAVYGSADSRPGVTAVYNGKTLTEGTDYTVKYPKTWKPGKNMITIQGKGSFSGSVKRAFTIEKAPMDKVTVSAKSTWQATGKKLSIVPDSVTLNGAALVLNKDYTVKYRSTSTGKAVSAVKTTGAYQMVLTGKGCYQGTKTVDFTVTDGTAVDNTNPTAPATTPETKPEAKPETKPETTVTGVGAVVDGLQLVESDIEGTFSTGDHIGQKVKLTATLSELENREESLKAFEQEVPWMMDVEECTDTDLSHYDIHCVATNIEGITDATQFTLKLKIDGVTKDSVVYGLNKYNNDDYDGLLGITCYDGYVAVRSSYKHFFNPKEIYIMVKK